MKSVITLGDQSLDEADFRLLGNGSWYNDNLITFFIEYLRHSHDWLGAPSSRLLLVPPNLTFFLAADFFPLEDVAAQAIPLKIHERDRIVLAVNSATKASAPVSFIEPSGVHWSVLIYEKASDKFFSIDSLQRSPNMEATRTVANRLNCLLHDGSRSDENIDVLVLSAPSQGNAADCGPFACAFMEQVVAATSRNISSVSCMDVDVNACNSFRERLREIITEFRE